MHRKSYTEFNTIKKKKKKKAPRFDFVLWVQGLVFFFFFFFLHRPVLPYLVYFIIESTCCNLGVLSNIIHRYHMYLRKSFPRIPNKSISYFKSFQTVDCTDIQVYIYLPNCRYTVHSTSCPVYHVTLCS